MNSKVELMTTHFRQEKDRSSAGTETPVKTKNFIAGESFGDSESNQIDHRTQHYDAYRAGYDYAYDFFMPRIIELENQLRWYINRNVTNMFHDLGYDGADNARQRSTQRFWNEYHQERDAA